jgi:prefoldin subunit 5
VDEQLKNIISLLEAAAKEMESLDQRVSMVEAYILSLEESIDPEEKVEPTEPDPFEGA